MNQIATILQMSRCTGVTKRGAACARTVVFPHTRCKAHREAGTNRHTSTSADTVESTESTDTRTYAHPATLSMYDELVAYHVMNPHNFDDETYDAGPFQEPRNARWSVDADEGRALCEQQDDEYARSLRKDRARSRWKKCRIAVHALIGLSRWQRLQLCSSVIRLIQRCEVQFRTECFSPCASQHDRNRIGDIVQKNKQIERWCNLWMAHQRVGDWDVSRMMDAHLKPTHILPCHERIPVGSAAQ